MNERVKTKALKTLDGLESIIRKERFIQGDYITSEVDPEFSGAICGGHKACLVGSLYLGYGEKPIEHHYPWSNEPMYGLNGVSPGERAEYMSHRPALRAVYRALNEAAARKVRRDPMLRRDYDGYLEDPQDGEGLAEALFEGGGCSSRGELLRLVKSARLEVEAA